jgi:hypothetical protein
VSCSGGIVSHSVERWVQSQEAAPRPPCCCHPAPRAAPGRLAPSQQQAGRAAPQHAGRAHDGQQLSGAERDRQAGARDVEKMHQLDHRPRPLGCQQDPQIEIATAASDTWTYFAI